MKTKVYAVISVLAAVVMAWPLMRLVMSPIGLFWLMPLLVSALGLFWSTCVMKNSRLAFVSGILFICLAFGGGILSWFALFNGGPNLMAFSSLLAVLFGAFSVIHAGMDHLNARNTIGEQDASGNRR